MMRILVLSLCVLALCAASLASASPSLSSRAQQHAARQPMPLTAQRVADAQAAKEQAAFEEEAEYLHTLMQKHRAQVAAQKKVTTAHMQVPDEEQVWLPALTQEQLDAFASSSQQPRSAPAEGNFELSPINKTPAPGTPSGLNFTTFKYPTPEGVVTIYVGITEYPAGKFHIYPAPRHAAAVSNVESPMEALAREQGLVGDAQCDGVAEVSVTAQHFGCEFAQNAGFFDMTTGGCIGDVVSNGVTINVAKAAEQGSSHFGLTSGGQFVTGYLTAAEVKAGVDGGFAELVQGRGWLIRAGKNYINESNVIENLGEGFMTEKAPRGALGHDSQGRLVQIEADGEEDIKLGLTLYELAAILYTHFNVENAINVDGGGSSTTVYNGAVVDHPTCHDTPVLCERSVTTISCTMK